MAKAWRHSRQIFPRPAVRAALAKASRCEQLARLVSLWAPPVDALPSDELRDWLASERKNSACLAGLGSSHRWP
jgi:hypothetical protein